MGEIKTLGYYVNGEWKNLLQSTIQMLLIPVPEK